MSPKITFSNMASTPSPITLTVTLVSATSHQTEQNEPRSRWPGPGEAGGAGDLQREVGVIRKQTDGENIDDVAVIQLEGRQIQSHAAQSVPASAISRSYMPSSNDR